MPFDVCRDVTYPASAVQVMQLYSVNNASDTTTVSPYDPVNGPITAPPGGLYRRLRHYDDWAEAGHDTRRAAAAAGNAQTGVVVNIQVPPQYPPGTTGVEDWLDRQLSALQTLFVLAQPGDLATALQRTLTKIGGGDAAAANVTLGPVCPETVESV